MTTWTEHGLCIGGVEILLRCDRGDLLDRLVAPYRGYRSTGRAPDVIHEYRARDGWRGEQAAEREYPAFDCRADGPRLYRFSRQDARGQVELPAAAGAPVAGRFEGRDAHHVLEATLRLAMCLAVPRLGGLLLHSAAALLGEDDARVFAGPSGAGKSTLYRLLEASGLRLLGDEITLCRPVAGAWHAFATPFAGECGATPDGHGRLRGLYFLSKAPAHAVKPISTTSAVPRLLRNALAYVDEREAAARALGAAGDLIGAVPCHILEFAKDPDVVGVLAVT